MTIKVQEQRQAKQAAKQAIHGKSICRDRCTTCRLTPKLHKHLHEIQRAHKNPESEMRQEKHDLNGSAGLKAAATQKDKSELEVQNLPDIAEFFGQEVGKDLGDKSDKCPGNNQEFMSSESLLGNLRKLHKLKKKFPAVSISFEIASRMEQAEEKVNGVLN